MKTGYINLEKLPGAGYARINGKSCIYVPYEGSPIIKRSEKGCYLSITLNESPNYGNDGFIAASCHSKETRAALSIEERKVVTPILGNFKTVDTHMSVSRKNSPTVEDDDLPM